MRDTDKIEPKTVPEEDAAARPSGEDTILLKDLAPRRDVQGGSGKLLFGQEATPAGNQDA